MTVSSERPQLKDLSKNYPIRQLQRNINDFCVRLGIAPVMAVLVDGVLGPETTAAIKYFQCLGGFPVNGQLNAEIIEFIKLGPDALPVLALAASGTAVLALQQVLARLDHQVLPNGQYGPETEQAVYRFQRQQKLPQTGIVGPRTWTSVLAARSRSIPCVAYCPALCNG